MSDAILNQILQNQNRQSEQLGGINEVVQRHDKVTFPAMQTEIKELGLTMKRIESKHNQDYLQYVDSNEELATRVKALEDAENARKEVKQEIKKGGKEIAWDVVKMGVMGGIGFIIAKFK
jgi:SepF-like predicted cell division protein (DUF552 family)